MKNYWLVYDTYYELYEVNSRILFFNCYYLCLFCMNSIMTDIIKKEFKKIRYLHKKSSNF